MADVRRTAPVENIVTLTYRSTHIFLVDLANGKLMVDAGWPGLLGALKSQLRAYDIVLSYGNRQALAAV